MTATLDALVATVGPGRLALIHANDSQGRLRLARATGTRPSARAPSARPPSPNCWRHPATAGVPVDRGDPDATGHAGHAADIATLTRPAPRLRLPRSDRLRAGEAPSRPSFQPARACAGRHLGSLTEASLSTVRIAYVRVHLRPGPRVRGPHRDPARCPHEETVGDACGAGTGCGTCLDRICDLIDEESASDTLVALAA